MVYNYYYMADQQNMTGKDRACTIRNAMKMKLKISLRTRNSGRRTIQHQIGGDGTTKYKSSVGIWRGGTEWTPNFKVVADMIGNEMRVDEGMLAQSTKQQQKDRRWKLPPSEQITRFQEPKKKTYSLVCETVFYVSHNFNVCFVLLPRNNDSGKS